ncbi:MAG: hypothetical protein JW918_07515 [Anaerolineae bacterium]|nr:hypothetical protein [Anaerolineae bacterium]
MIPVTPIIGLSVGMLLTAFGLALWNGFRQTAGLDRAAQVISWIAGGLLLIAFPLLWSEAHGHYTHALHLILMAAVAAPSINRRHHLPWNDAIRMLPALALSGIGLALVAENFRGAHYTDLPALPTWIIQEGLFAQPPTISLAGPSIPLGMAFMLCDGLVARVLGEALGTLVTPTATSSRLFDILYMLLTLLVGAITLATLWQRGVVWEKSPAESGLLGVWLAWSAAWLSPREHPRLRAALIATATLSLVLLALEG